VTLVLPQRLFYVVRHAQSTDNAAGLISGAGSDPNLTDFGRMQAMEAGAVLRSLQPQPERVIVSGLKRTLQTAEHMVSALEIVADARLNERHLGELDGKISETVQKTYGKLPGEEKSSTHRDRVREALQFHLECDERVPLFICHGGTARRIFEILELESTAPIPNARIFKIMPDNNKWQLIG